MEVAPGTSVSLSCQERVVKRHRPNLDCAGDVKDDTVGFCDMFRGSHCKGNILLFSDRKLNLLGIVTSPVLLPPISTAIVAIGGTFRSRLAKLCQKKKGTVYRMDLYLVLPTKIGASVVLTLVMMT